MSGFKRRRLTVFLVFVICVSIGCQKEDAEDIILGENQQVIYATVTEITGNKMSYKQVEDSVAESIINRQTEEKKQKKKEESTEQYNREGLNDNAGKPDNAEGMGDGRIPGNGEMPENTGMQKGRDMLENGEILENTEVQEGSTAFSEAVASKYTEETYIPVGIPVYTSEDKETTFSRIVSGDLLKILIQTDDDGNDTIIKIWMVNQA